MKRKLSVLNISLHIAGCLAFVFLPFISSPKSSIFETLVFGPPEIKGLVNSVLLVCFFYFNYLYLIPSFYQQKKYFTWTVITLFCFILILVIPNIFIDNANPPLWEEMHGLPRPDHHPFEKEHSPVIMFLRDIMFQESLLRFMFVWALSFLIRISQLWRKSQEEKRTAELNYLKSQVNPHFLFNTLNGIYALSLTDAEKTPEAILKLSELMRYVTTEIQHDSVRLNYEIEHIKNYVELQKIRLGNTVDIHFSYENVKQELQIPPLLLMPFVENAFKYGLINNQKSIIEIELKSTDNTLFFRTFNHFSNTKDNTKASGIENVKKRLELIFAKNYNLNIKKSATDFVVELKLNLKL